MAGRRDARHHRLGCRRAALAQLPRLQSCACTTPRHPNTRHARAQAAKATPTRSDTITEAARTLRVSELHRALRGGGCVLKDDQALSCCLCVCEGERAQRRYQIDCVNQAGVGAARGVWSSRDQALSCPCVQERPQRSQQQQQQRRPLSAFSLGQGAGSCWCSLPDPEQPELAPPPKSTCAAPEGQRGGRGAAARGERGTCKQRRPGAAAEAAHTSFPARSP